MSKSNSYPVLNGTCLKELRDYRSQLLNLYDAAIINSRTNKNYIEWLDKTIVSLSEQIYRVLKEG